MKIAVLFGSFNPITNAHVAAMEAAVSYLGADKGLFVATNGKYLKKKTVKIGDPFYLTEQERRETIEKLCAGRKGLAFWGFEMGGISPKRYQTLRKIQKQYPEAVLYEIQGADKVRTISRFSDGADYVANVRFLVFERGGVDVKALLDSDPLLKQHRDAFTLLPPLPAEGEISSTEVRRRFYAGEDTADLIPPSAQEVLSRHTPSDFSISFSDRMQVLMRDGRFGANKARKEVYGANLDLFLRWKAGDDRVGFGDYRAFLDGAELYEKSVSVEGKGTVYSETVTGCANVDCVDLAEELIEKGYRPAILNLASSAKPGGGYRDGLGAQEESLCRSSNLSLSLYQFGNPKYVNVRESGVPFRVLGYPFDLNFGGIYTPNVSFFRGGEAKLFALRDRIFSCDVITVAALCFNGRSHYSHVSELSYRNETGGFTLEGEEIMCNKIRTIFRMGVLHDRDALVLGAFGCGAYRLPVPEVVKLFRRVMEEREFQNKFRLITFAILERSRGPHGPDGAFADFYREFGTL